MLTWQQTEFLLKGVYLGLLVTIALLVPSREELAIIGGVTVAGLAICLGIAAVQKIREGFRVKGRLLGFLIFLVLENPCLVYAGVLLGLSAGTMLTFNRRELPPGVEAIPLDKVWPILGGAVLGYIFYGMRHVRQRLHRFGIGMAMIAVLSLGAWAVVFFNLDFLKDAERQMIGFLLLLGIPGFYLLTFSGLVEESEIEIAAMCAALGIGSWSIASENYKAVGSAVVLVPLLIFFVYTSRWMAPLRVFKHALRGMSYRQMGQTKLALISLGRALQLDPQNPLARAEMWGIHRDLDFGELHKQPDIIPFLHFEFCMERISQMLQTKPTPEEVREMFKMLDLIAKEQPAMAPICAYWRAVAHLHEQKHEEAAGELESILKLPQYQTQAREAVHYSAWNLAMFGHPDMKWRVADRLLWLPGHRMDAIAAVEGQLALTPNDPGPWDMKRLLYSELTEKEYWTMIQPEQPLPRISYEYVEQLGNALLEDPLKWPRGCEYLRIAAHGQPMRSASIYITIAQTHEKHGDTDGLWANYTTAMRIGRAAGIAEMTPEQKGALFASVKAIGEAAVKADRLEVALEAFKFYSQHEAAGIETWRMLAELFERLAQRGDASQNTWQALHCCEHALTYNAADKDLIERKDRYYYSITPAELEARIESVHKWFDPQYCRDKAGWILDNFRGDFEVLDWAAHLLDLALTAQPGSHAARFTKARLHRLRGEIPETIALLEEIRQHRPEKFANAEESKAWYFGHRLLGDLYLDTKPKDAAACYEEFRLSDEAGADTSFKLGKAYEAAGELKKAAVCYDEVTAYENHPLYHQAREALDRIRRGRAPAAQQQSDLV